MSKREGKKILKGAKSAGEQYARDAVESDHYRQWVYDQIYEASRMDPSQVLPLETAADAKVIAENTLQQLGWDVRRDLTTFDILEMSDPSGFTTGSDEDWRRRYGIDESDITKEFYEGFDKALKDSKVVAWLADEILSMHEQITGRTAEGAREARSPRARAAQPPRRRLPPSKDVPIPAIPVYRQGDPKANYAIETLGAQGGRRTKWRFDSGYYATLEDAIAMSESLIGFHDIGWFKGVRVVDVRQGYKPVWEWPERKGRFGREAHEAQAPRGASPPKGPHRRTKKSGQRRRRRGR